MTLDRKDYKSAIPQLEKRLSEVEKIGKDAFNKFEDIAHQTQLDAAEAEKKVLALDYQMDTLKVVTEYAIVPTGYDPDDWSGTTWDTTMPNLDADSFAPTTQYPNGFTLWARSKTYRNDIVVQYTDPQPVELMDGVFTFVNTVASNAGWTTINGDTITTGKITSRNGYCYFDIDNNNFQMKDGASLANSDNALAWDGSLGTLYIKGDIEIAKDGLSYLKAYLDNTMPTVRVGSDEVAYILITPEGMQLRRMENGVSKLVSSFSPYQVKLGDFAELSTNGLEVQNVIQLKYGNTTKCEIDSTGITINSGDLEADGISFKNHRHALRGGMFDVGTGTTVGGIGLSVPANDYIRVSATMTNSSNAYPIGLVGWNLDGTGAASLNIFEYYLSDRAYGSCKVNVAVKNPNSSAASATLHPRILWIKNDYGGGTPRMT